MITSCPFEMCRKDYEIRSIKAGSVDVMNGKIHIDGKTSMSVEVRIGARSADRVSDLVKVTGIINIPSNLGIGPQHVYLCCVGDSTEGFSAPLGPDGSFEFSGVPSSTYTIEINESRVFSPLNEQQLCRRLMEQRSRCLRP